MPGMPPPPPPPPFFLLMPEMMSSMRRSIAAASMAVLRVCCFTAKVSMTPSAFTSVTTPFWPSMPQCAPPATAWRARRSVITRTTSAPQLWARLRGITSSASATARYAYWRVPSISLAFSFMRAASSISTAPPPGSSLGSRMMFLATLKASCRFRSISFSTSREAPRKITEQALGSLHSVMKVKYSSPICLILKRPAPVPMECSVNSSVRLQMEAPVTRAMRLLSVLRTRLMTEMFAFSKKCCARSETPFSVMTTSGLILTTSSHIFRISSSSCISSFSQSASLVISTLVWLSPFLYSRGQSSRQTRGFLISRRIRGWVMSLLTITPSSTSQSVSSPPESFSTLAYRLTSMSFVPSAFVMQTVCTAFRAKSEMRLPHLLENLVSIAPFTMPRISSGLFTSMGYASSFRRAWLSSRAFM
mmetsp:Transcript_95723/g.249366  ORF Transcript_95723/g.249366 Transcript_95723/m.249366 type:complete len:418 (-) Transcript_95723:500-1753(-)